MTEYLDYWEQWAGSTARPVERIKHRAKVTKRDGRKWITYLDEINGAEVVVEMPETRRPSRAIKAATTTAHTDSAHRRKEG